MHHLIPEALRSRTVLHNHYHEMRHTDAESNAKRILAGDPAIALTGFGATSEGKAKLAHIVRQRHEAGEPVPDLIVATDLRRGAESAHLYSKTLGGAPVVILDPRLRERFWGVWEGTDENNCFHVYAHDRRDLHSHPHQAETVASMVGRVSSLILDLEQTYTGKRIVLIGHADILQMVDFVFSQPDIAHYTDIPYLKNAEIRKLEFLPRKIAAAAAIDHLFAETDGWAKPALRGSDPVFAATA